MARDVRETIRRLEAKAVDRATPAPERVALLDKAEQLRAKLLTTAPEAFTDDELTWETVDLDGFARAAEEAWAAALRKPYVQVFTMRQTTSSSTPVSDLFRR